MGKEWILNSATNRFQYNFKRNVGATSESIRKCSPKSLEEWRDYYFSNIRPIEHIEELGRKLYFKITEHIKPELDTISEQDCIDYITNLVINRTFDGYMTEISTIYSQLENILEVKIEQAPDEWDRLYNVDFFINIKDKYIGIQVKPVNKNFHISEIYKERDLQERTHKKFYEKYGGKVFYIYSLSKDGRKEILNKEVINEILLEIEHLKNN